VLGPAVFAIRTLVGCNGLAATIFEMHSKTHTKSVQLIQTDNRHGKRVCKADVAKDKILHAYEVALLAPLREPLHQPPSMLQSIPQTMHRFLSGCTPRTACTMAI
jgi:hypothetical protein